MKFHIFRCSRWKSEETSRPLFDNILSAKSLDNHLLFQKVGLLMYSCIVILKNKLFFMFFQFQLEATRFFESFFHYVTPF